MNNVISSEEKLLNLIRRKKSVPSSTSDGKHDKVPVKDKVTPHDIWQTGCHILLGTTGILLVVLVVRWQTLKSATMVPQASQEKHFATGAQRLDERFASAGLDYKKVIRERNIFLLPSEQRQLEPDSIQSSTTLSARYKLKGILLDNAPVALIEDTENRQVMIVSKGQKVGDAVLKDIMDNRVVFDYQDQLVQLVR